MPGMNLAKTHQLVVGEYVTRNALPIHVDVKKTFSISFSRGELQMSMDLEKDVREYAAWLYTHTLFRSLCRAKPQRFASA